MKSSEEHFFPKEVYNTLWAQTTSSGTAYGNVDPIPLSIREDYGQKVRKVIISQTGSALLMERYRYDTMDVDGPLNQDLFLITCESGSTIIRKLPNNPAEHHAHTLPQRHCNFLNCGSCTKQFSGTAEYAFCCRTGFVSGISSFN